MRMSVEVAGGGASEGVGDADPKSLCNQWRSILSSHCRSVDWLEQYIHENPSRITDGGEQVWVRGELARYSFDKDSLLATIRNQFSSSALDCTTIHRLISGEGAETEACIQISGEVSSPTADSIKAFLMGLINDHVTFSRIGTLRTALLELYGLRHSPISAVLAEYHEQRYGGRLDAGNGIMEVEGSNNWVWRIIEQPGGELVIDVLAERRKNWRRLLTGSEDGAPERDNISHLMWLLSESPRTMIEEPYHFFYGPGSGALIEVVSQFHGPLRIALKEHDLLSQTA